MTKYWLTRGVIAFLFLIPVCLGTGAFAGGEGIHTAELQQLLEAAPEGVFLLDVRTPREFSGGRIPGSVLIPMNQVPGRLGEIPRDQKVVVVCASGARSGAVTSYLKENGLTDVVNYTDGVFDWARKGLQLER